MQANKAQELRKAWGNKPCDHSELDKEYYLGAQTGDYVCITCGRNFTREERFELEKKRKSNSE